METDLLYSIHLFLLMYFQKQMLYIKLILLIHYNTMMLQRHIVNNTNDKLQ